MNKYLKWTSFLSPLGWAGAFMVALVIMVTLFWVIDGPSRHAREAAIAKANQITAAAHNDAVKDATEVVLNNSDNAAAIDATTRKNDDDIRSLPGASAPVSADVDGAGRNSICLRKSAHNLPECRGVLKARP